MTSWWSSTPAAISTGDCGHATSVNVIATLTVESHDQLWRLDEKARLPGALCGAVALLRALAHGAMRFGDPDRFPGQRLDDSERERRPPVGHGARRQQLRRLLRTARSRRLHRHSARDGQRHAVEPAVERGHRQPNLRLARRRQRHELHRASTAVDDVRFLQHQHESGLPARRADPGLAKRRLPPLRPGHLRLEPRRERDVLRALHLRRQRSAVVAGSDDADQQDPLHRARPLHQMGGGRARA